MASVMYMQGLFYERGTLQSSPQSELIMPFYVFQK